MKKKAWIRDADVLAAVVGAAVGIVLFKRMPMALICAFAGVLVGRRVLDRSGQRPSRGPSPRGAVPSGAGSAWRMRHIEAHVRLFGAVAREGGEFDEVARVAARSWFVVDQRAGAAEIASIDALLNAEAKRGSEPARQAATRLVAMAKSSRKDRIQILFSLFRVALTRPLTYDRERGLTEAAAGLDLTQADYDGIRADFIVTVRGRASEADYRVLDLPPGAPEKVVRERYRDYVKTYHPDRYEHLGKEFADVAAEKFKSIQGAYDRIVEALQSTSDTEGRPRTARCPNCRKFTALDEASCIRCGHVKFESERGGRSLRCGSCGQMNPLAAMEAHGAVACRNCRVVIVQ